MSSSAQVWTICKAKQQEKRNAVEDNTYKISFQFVYIILKLKKIQSIFNMSKRNHDDRQNKQAVGLESHYLYDSSVKLLRSVLGEQV